MHTLKGGTTIMEHKMSVVVTDYNDEWPQKFEEEAALIRSILQDEVLEIHHIGSTSVPGMKAKPIIDMMPVVREIERVDAYDEHFAAIGYEAMGEFGIQGRRYFRKGSFNRTHHIHIFSKTHQKDIERHLAVRDYLRAHPQEAHAYGELKAELASKFPTDSALYSDGKDDFVQRLEKRAMEWRNSTLNL